MVKICIYALNQPLDKLRLINRMNILETLQRITLLFLLGFPLIMVCLVGFLSISVLNVGMIFLSVGQILIVPVITTFLQFVTWILPGTKVPPSDIGLLVPSVKEALATSSFNVAPSFWVAQTVFICSYVFMNAYTVYNLKAGALGGSAGASWKVENRKARSLMVMIVCVISLIGLLVSRYLMTGAETIFGIIIGLAAFIPISYYWYENAIRNGAQNGDILGILQQMIPAMNDDAKASLCVKSV